MTEVQVPADGNCLFRALAFPSTRHAQLRRTLVHYMRARWDKDYAPFVADEERERYTIDMMQDGTWGDELVLRAFSDALGMCVRVYDHHTGQLIQVYGERFAGPSRRLIYDGSHYNPYCETKQTTRS